MKVYLGSPFFNEDQLKTVKSIEKALDDANISYFSPRSEGVLIDMTPEEREDKFKKIFHSNIYNMNDCNIMIANIDDRDIGTAVEISYMYSSNKPVFSFSGNNYIINIMMRQMIKSHNVNIDNLMTNINQYMNNKPLTIFDELTKNVT